MSRFRTWDGMRWPCPGPHLSEFGYKLRNSHPHLVKVDFFDASSLAEAYAELIRMPQKRRNEIIRELRKGPDRP